MKKLGPIHSENKETNEKLSNILSYLRDIWNILTEIWEYDNRRMDSEWDYDFSKFEEQITTNENEIRNPDDLNLDYITIDSVVTAVKIPWEEKIEKFPAKITISYNIKTKMVVVFKDFGWTLSPLKTRTERYSVDWKSMKWNNEYINTTREDGYITDLDQISKRIYNIQKLSVEYYDNHKKRLVWEIISLLLNK